MSVDETVNGHHADTFASPASAFPLSRLWAALIFAMVFPTIMAWLYFVALAPESTRPAVTGNFAVVAAYALGKIIQFAFPLVFVLVYEPYLLRLRRPNRRGLLWGLGFGLAVGAGMILLYQLRLHQELVHVKAPEKIEAKLRHFGLYSPARFLAFAAFISLVHSLLEEYYWRWFVFGRLTRCVPVGVALVLSGLAFMAHHVVVLAEFLPGTRQFVTKVVPLSLAIAVGGVILAWLYYRTGSIYAPWIGHLVIDAAIMVVGYSMVFGG